VCAFVQRAFAVSYTAHAMAKLLKRLGFVYKKPKGVPAKADAEAQRRFFEETLAPLLAKAGADNPVYFTDAAHPAYTAHPGYGWIRKGETRELNSNHGRVRVNINGALSWPDRQVVHRTAEKITSAAMIALFEDLQARHPTASAIWVVLDNARYNHSIALRTWLAGEGCRIRPVYLPAYSPNLNLIERFWRRLKDAVLRNAYFPTYAAFKAAIEDFFAHLGDCRAQIESLITDRFHFIGEQNPQAP
jgi:transposase